MYLQSLRLTFEAAPYLFRIIQMAASLGGSGPRPHGGAGAPAPAEPPTTATAILERATADKEASNAAFRADDLSGALKGYKRILLTTRSLQNGCAAMAAFSGSPSMSESDELRYHELLSTVYGNIAAVYLKMGDAESLAKAVDHSSKSIDEDLMRTNGKAHLRKVQALSRLGRVPEARAAAEAALTVYGFGGSGPVAAALRSEIKELTSSAASVAKGPAISGAKPE